MSYFLWNLKTFPMTGLMLEQVKQTFLSQVYIHSHLTAPVTSEIYTCRSPPHSRIWLDQRGGAAEYSIASWTEHHQQLHGLPEVFASFKKEKP